MRNPGLWLLAVVLLWMVLWLVARLWVYLWVPIRIRRRQTVAADVRFGPAEMSDLVNQSGHWAVDTATQLAGLGFNAAAHLRAEGLVSDVDGVTSIWVHPAPADVAHLVFARTARGMTGETVSFRTEFSDGTSLTTSNATIFSSWVADPKGEVVMCLGLGKLDRLYRLHRARAERRVAESGGKLRAVLPEAGKEAEYLASRSKERMAQQVASGYYVLDETARVYRFTWKGAYLSVWKRFWPLKQILAARRQRTLEQVLRELGLGHRHEYWPTRGGGGAGATLSYAVASKR